MVTAYVNGIPVQIKGDKKIISDMELQIRQITWAMIRNVKSYVTEQSVSKPLLEIPVPEALGVIMPDILSTAADKYNGSWVYLTKTL